MSVLETLSRKKSLAKNPKKSAKPEIETNLPVATSLTPSYLSDTEKKEKTDLISKLKVSEKLLKTYPRFFALIGLSLGIILGTIVGYLLFFDWDYSKWEKSSKDFENKFYSKRDESSVLLSEKNMLKTQISSLETEISNLKNDPSLLSKKYQNKDFKFSFVYWPNQDILENQASGKDPFSVEIKSKNDSSQNIKLRIFGKNNSTTRSLVYNYYVNNECSGIPVFEKADMEIGDQKLNIDKATIPYKNCGPEKLEFNEVFYIFTLDENRFMLNGITPKTEEMITELLKSLKTEN